jgi:5-carboxymethyl-2-hydroxymuconate isomerase
MPHISIDYSSNLEAEIDTALLCDTLRRAAIETGEFPMAGVRVRAFAATHVSIADGNPEHGYIDISVRLRGGRDLPTRERATAHIFDAAEAFLAPVMARRSLALSLEMRDIDPALSPKSGSIRDHLGEIDPQTPKG